MKRTAISRFSALCLAAVLLLFCCACRGSGNNGADPTEPAEIDVLAPTEGGIPADGTKEPVVTENTATESAPTEQNTDEPSEDPSESPDASVEPTEGTEAPTEIAATPTPTTAIPTPIVSGQPTTAPTPTTVPDPSAAPLWFDDSAAVNYDMDFDGKPETVRIELTHQSGYSYNCKVSVKVGSTGTVITDSFTTEYFTKALLNNFNSGDGRAELLVSCGTGNRGQITKIYRLNANSTALQSIATNGWVETLGDNAIELGRYIDVLGTWACSCSFGFSTGDFSLRQISEAWQVHRDSNRWCTLSQSLLVEIFVNNANENYAGFLYYGDRIYPTETDLRSYIKFVSDLGDRGSITVTAGSNGTLLINGESPDHWFSDLQYIR